MAVAMARSKCPVMLFLSICFLVFLSLIKGVVCTTNISLSVLDKQISRLNFFPSRIEELVEKQIVDVFFNYTVYGVNANVLAPNNDEANESYLATGSGKYSAMVKFSADDASIADVVTHPDGDLQARPNSTYFAVRGNFLGRTFLKVSIRSSEDANVTVSSSSKHEWREISKYKICVVRKKSVLDTVFIVSVALLVICSNIGMGCKVDLQVIMEVLRRPFAPAVGFFCQFIVMPLTAFATIRLLGFRGGIALGLFATGCAPGGGASNFYTYLFGADVSLSVTMTLVSIIGSLGMIPLWFFTLGRHLAPDDTAIHVPFFNIFVTLFSLLVPIAVGLLLQRRHPRVAAVIVRLLKPMIVFFIVFMFTFGVYTNLYIFRLITPALLIAGCLMPYVGFAVGGALAALTAQPWGRIVAIAVETGIQNTGIPILLMKYSLPQPEADISVVSPVIVAMFTPIPLWIGIAVVEWRKRRGKAKAGGGEEDVEGGPRCDLLSEVTPPGSVLNGGTVPPPLTNGKAPHGPLDVALLNGANTPNGGAPGVNGNCY